MIAQTTKKMIVWIVYMRMDLGAVATALLLDTVVRIVVDDAAAFFFYYCKQNRIQQGTFL